MRKWKCTSVNNGNRGAFTIGKIYETDDEGYSFIVDGGHKIKNLSLIDEMKCYDGQLQFNEIKEEEKKVNKFKVGDKVRIIGNKSSGHKFNIGEVAKIEKIYNEGTDKEHCKARNESKSYYVSYVDIELFNKLTSKTLTITTSDSTTTLTDGTHTVSVNRYYTDKHDEEVAVSEVTDKYYEELARIEREKNTPKVGDKVKVVDSNDVYPNYKDWLIENNVPIRTALKWEDDNKRFTQKEYKVVAIHPHREGSKRMLALIEGEYEAFIIDIEGLKVVK